MSILEVKNLSVEYHTANGPLRAIDDVSLTVNENEIMGVVGESGCGKSTFIKSILNLLDSNGRIVDGEITFMGEDLIGKSKKELNKIRWSKLSYIPQTAMNALNPVQRIGKQMVEAVVLHTDDSKAEARTRAEEMLEAVDIDPERLSDYPHELSGGQKQRVVIALSLLLSPSLVIADEPTTGLDVIVQDQILDLLENIQNEFNLSMIVVTHDMSVVSEITNKVAVFYGGQIMEKGLTTDIFNTSSHPYTIGLTQSFPSLTGDISSLVSIPGDPPNLVSPPKGCRFEPRCPFATEECKSEPPLIEVRDSQYSKCHYSSEYDRLKEEGQDVDMWSQAGVQ